MIPKKIHYCWFGRGKKPRLAEKCIASWRKYCPDYQIIEWNEDNFDVYMNGYTAMCMEQKKYAFLSDYARLVIIEKEGGIYFDTDVELVRSPDFLLRDQAFFGFENDSYIASGLGFGAEAGSKVMRAMLAEYEPLLDGQHGTVGCPILNTQALEKEGLVKNGRYQLLDHTAIYPAEYFNSYDSVTGRLRKTRYTVSIHWYSASWMSLPGRIRSRILRPVRRLIGAGTMRKVRKWLRKE